MYGSFPQLCSPYVCVANGASKATAFSSKDPRRTFRTEIFDVLVLRHNPCDMRVGNVRTVGGAEDPTGPLGWRKLWPEKDPAVWDLLDANARSMLELWENLLDTFERPVELGESQEGYSRDDARHDVKSKGRLRRRRYTRRRLSKRMVCYDL